MCLRNVQRTLIDNEDLQADRASRMDLETADGSIDLYVGPKALEGLESNWIQSIAGKSWLGDFRLYGPTEVFFDRS